MSGIVSFDDLFPLKASPTALDRVFGFDSGDGKSRGFTIQAILDLIDATPVTWGEITGKPSTFAPAAHTIGSHSNVAGTVDSAADGTFLKKVGGQVQAVAVDFYGVSNPPPPDPSIDDAVRLITALKTSQWDSAFGWGNHAGQYRPVAWVPAWGDVTGKPATFAPAAHTLASHSDAAALSAATEGQLVRKAAIGFEAFTADYYSPFNPPPVDASIPGFVRDFTIGQFAGYEAKMLEFSELPDGAIPLIKDGVPADSQLKGIYSENPFDPVTEEEDYNAFVEELLYLISTKRIKGPNAEDADDYATLGQVPVLFEDDLAAIAEANAPNGLNPFATMGDLFSRSVYDLLQSGATDGQAIVWSDANNRYEPGTVAGGGGADTNAVHYNAADGKTKTEQQQARDNIGSIDGIGVAISLGSNQANWNPGTANFFKLSTGSRTVQGIVSTGRQDGELMLISMVSGTLHIANESASAVAENRVQTPNGLTYSTSANEIVILRYNTSLNRWQFLTPYLRAIGAQTKSGAMTFVDAVSFQAIGSVDISGAGNSFIGAAGRGVLRVFNSDTSLPVLQIRGNGSLHIRNAGLPNSGFMTVDGFWYDSINDTLQHGRSSDYNKSIRRDEQLLLYPITVTTAGIINDLAQTPGIFNYGITAATQINGMADGENGKIRYIQNDNSVNCTMGHENAGSIASNRYDIIGGADLVVPPGGITGWVYRTANSRWRLFSKNF